MWREPACDILHLDPSITPLYHTLYHMIYHTLSCLQTGMCVETNYQLKLHHHLQYSTSILV